MVNADEPDDGAIPVKTEAKSPEDGIMIWNDGYYYCLRQQADDVDHHTGTCYNCRETGHHWRECPHPLRQALHKAKDWDGDRRTEVKCFWGQWGKGSPQSPKSGSEPKANSS